MKRQEEIKAFQKKVESIVEKLREESCGNNYIGGSLYSVKFPDDDSPISEITFNVILNDNKQPNSIRAEWDNKLFSMELKDDKVNLISDIPILDLLSFMNEIFEYMDNKLFYCTPDDLVGSKEGNFVIYMNNIVVIRITKNIPTPEEWRSTKELNHE